ncbi:regulatory protein, luxR family, partial [Streptosporangium subroseum]
STPARTWLLAAEGDLDGALRSLTEVSVLASHDAFDSYGVFAPHEVPVPHDASTSHDMFASHDVFAPYKVPVPHDASTSHDMFASHDVFAPYKVPVPHDALASHDVFALHDAVRLGAPGLVVERLRRWPGGLASLLTAHATALISRDGQALDRVASRLEQRGLLLHAAEASAQAAMIHRDHRAARTSRNRASTLARRCQGARTPVLVDATLGELTPRQRQIVGLAATGLTNRQIAEQLTLSIRTVANHLYGAYERLGSGDRTGLGSLF